MVVMRARTWKTGMREKMSAAQKAARWLRERSKVRPAMQEAAMAAERAAMARMANSDSPRRRVKAAMVQAMPGPLV
jgi:hypothetical protein